MAAPFETRNDIRRALGKALTAMNSPRFVLELDTKPKKTQERAARLLLSVMKARLRITNAQLADLRDDLVTNETAFRAGKKRLEGSLKNLKKTKEVLDATAAFLQIVARLAAIAASGAL